MKLNKKKEQELKATITSETSDALGYQNGKLVKERSLALDYYNSEKMGNEVRQGTQMLYRRSIKTLSIQAKMLKRAPYPNLKSA